MATATLTTDLVTVANAESTDTGTWSGGKSSLYWTEAHIEGSGCRAYIGNSVATYYLTYTPASSLNIGSSSVLRIWSNITDAFRCDTKTNGGIQIFVGDGTNTGYWNYDGKDTYTGGYKQLLIDTGTSPSNGSTPNWSAITNMGVTYAKVALGKNTETAFIDAIRYGNTIIATGGTSGDEITIEDIYQADKTNAYGIITKNSETGVYSIRGNLQIGDNSGTLATYFKTTGEVIIAEAFDWGASDMLSITFNGNTTGNTTVSLEGCFINGADDQLNIYTIDKDINSLTFDGNTFKNINGLHLQSGFSVINNVFSGCYQITPSASTFENNTISDTLETSSSGALLWDGVTNNVTDCNFINNSAGVEITASGSSISFDNLQFDDVSGNYDVNNSSGDPITVSLTNGSNANSYTGTTVTFNAAINLTIHVVDTDGSNIRNATCYIEDSTPTQLMNEFSSSTGIATETYNYAGDKDIVAKVRKYGYKHFKTTGTILNQDLNITATMVSDPQQT